MTNYDPFNDGTEPAPEPQGNPIRTDRSKAGSSRFTIEVKEVTEPLEGDYGQYVLVVGELKFQADAIGGTSDDPRPAPEVGEEVTFLVSYRDPAEKKGLPHLQEEITKALRRIGQKGDFLREGDLLSVKLAELQTHKANGTKYPKGKEFGRHVVVVTRPSTDDPWSESFTG